MDNDVIPPQVSIIHPFLFSFYNGTMSSLNQAHSSPPPLSAFTKNIKATQKIAMRHPIIPTSFGILALALL